MYRPIQLLTNTKYIDALDKKAKLKAGDYSSKEKAKKLLVCQLDRLREL